MNAAAKPRLVWFDANRACAAMGVVLIHSTTDFAGKPFANFDPDQRLFPVFLRSLGEFSGSEMFFLFSLFLMAMRVDRKLPSYRTAIGQQAERLLVPFAFWVLFYAFFRLIKASVFGYEDYIWGQLGEARNWLGYFVLGKVQYHMHFLPTLFLLFLFYPLMRGATRYPIFGLTLFFTLGVMNNTQAFVWGSIWTPSCVITSSARSRCWAMSATVLPPSRSTGSGKMACRGANPADPARGAVFRGAGLCRDPAVLCRRGSDR